MKKNSAVLKGYKKCTICKEEKPLAEFYPANALKTIFAAPCRICASGYNLEVQRRRAVDPAASDERRNRKQERKNALRAYVAEYFSKNPCVDCGYSNIDALTFDHVRGDKTANVSHMVASVCSLENLKMEILKCDVRCANCHMIKTKRDIKEKSARGELKKKKKSSLIDPDNAEITY